MKNSKYYVAGVLCLLSIPSITTAALSVQVNSNVTSASNVTSTSVVLGGSGELYIDADHWSQACSTGGVLQQDQVSDSKIYPWVTSLSVSHAHSNSPENWNWHVHAEHQYIVCNHLTGEYKEGEKTSNANGSGCS